MRFDIFRQPKAKGGIWARMSEHLSYIPPAGKYIDGYWCTTTDAVGH